MATVHQRYQPTRTSRIAHRDRSPTAETDLIGAEAPAIGRRPFDAASVVALQRTHGNAHVQRLLADPRVQRYPDDDEDMIRNDEVIDRARLSDKENVPLFELSTGKGINWHMRYQSNTEARRVIHQFNGCQGVHEDWTDAMHLLETHSGKGFGVAQKVERAGGAIGSASKGQAGQYTRERIQDYIKATKEAEGQLRKLGQQRDRVGNAMTKINEILVTQKIHAQKQTVEKSESDVKEEEERVKSQKEFIGGVLDLMGGLTDPTEWVKLVVDSAIFLGKKAVDAHLPSSRLDQLKKDLAQAKKRLVTLQDAEIALKLKDATEKLAAEQKKLVDAKTTYEELFGNLQMMQTSVVEALGQSSRTKGAGGAIKERGMVANAAVTAKTKIQDYMALSGLLLGQMDKLEEDYGTLYRIADQLGHGRSQREAIIEHFRTVPPRNVDTLHTLRNQINMIRSNSEDDMAYLATGEFLEGYDSIEETLESAVINRNGTP